jgi:hypothetical protein
VRPLAWRIEAASPQPIISRSSASHWQSQLLPAIRRMSCDIGPLLAWGLGNLWILWNPLTGTFWRLLKFGPCRIPANRPPERPHHVCFAARCAYARSGDYHLPICLSVYLSIHPSTHPSIHLYFACFLLPAHPSSHSFSLRHPASVALSRWRLWLAVPPAS